MTAKMIVNHGRLLVWIAYQSVMSMSRHGDVVGYVDSFDALGVELGI